jgi:hypothetical protein
MPNRRTTTWILIGTMLCASWGFAGCATWHGVSRSDLVPTIERRRPDLIRIMQEGSVREVRTPLVRDDSLLGVINGPHGREGVAFRLSSIDSIAVREYNRTPLRIVAGTLVALSVAWLILISHPRHVK